MTPRQLAGTDWDAYYANPYPTAVYSRRITSRILIRYIVEFVDQHASIVELGGANSTFFDAIYRRIQPREYHIIDNNRLGLDRFRPVESSGTEIFVHEHDILQSYPDVQADLVFSIGLIEHFTPDETCAVVQTHFSLLKPGGLCIISFPTPTFLYRVSRLIAESLGVWIFHDERPIPLVEFETYVKHATILDHQIIWPIFFTQGIYVMVDGDQT